MQSQSNKNSLSERLSHSRGRPPHSLPNLPAILSKLSLNVGVAFPYAGSNGHLQHPPRIHCEILYADLRNWFFGVIGFALTDIDEFQVFHAGAEQFGQSIVLL